MRTLEDFTTEEIKTVCNFIQALDIEAEKTFQKPEIQKRWKELKLSESDIAELADHFTSQFPFQIILMNGHGYRSLYSALTNVLSLTNHPELRGFVRDFREDEEL